MTHACPICNTPLQKSLDEHGSHLRCPGCGMRGVSIAVLRRFVDRGFVNQLWQQARTAPSGTHSCPTCPGVLRRILFPGDPQGKQLEVCAACQVVWLSESAFAQLPAKVEPQSSTLDLTAEQTMAIEASMKREGHDWVNAFPDRDRGPDTWWETALGMLGLLVEENGEKSFPRATIALTLLLVLAAAFSLSHPAAVHGLGLIPAEWTLSHALNLFSYALPQHAWQFMVLGAYLLMLTGRFAEAKLGVLPMLTLFWSGILMGAIACVIFGRGSSEVLAGFSPGVLALIVFYTLMHPGRRLRYLFFSLIPFRYRWYSIPIWMIVAPWILWLLLMLLLQLFQLRQQVSLMVMAQTGGAIAGMLFALINKRRSAAVS